MDLTQADPKGLIRESFAIEGITAAECRSIFIDWALSLAAGIDTPVALHMLIGHYARPDHPMTHVLTQALTPAPAPTRRGGRGAKLGY